MHPGRQFLTYQSASQRSNAKKTQLIPEAGKITGSRVYYNSVDKDHVLVTNVMKTELVRPTTVSVENKTAARYSI